MNNQQYFNQWVLYCGGGELLGIASASAIAVGHNYFMAEPQSLTEYGVNLAVMLVAGAVEGSILGYLQWKVLVKHFRKLTAWSWIRNTVAVSMLGWGIGMLVSFFAANGQGSEQEPTLIVFLLAAGAMGLSLGLLFGLFQYWVLRKHSKEAFSWIWTNALGWMLGMIFIFLAASLPTEITPIPMIIGIGAAGGILAGLSVGVITGLALLNMHPIVEENIPPTPKESIKDPQESI
jgi:uncharacterized membrane protein YidH (DUF202 family)